MTAEQVYGRRAVREALRGPREVLELWATERAVAAEDWLRENGGPRVQVKPERELTDAAGTRDHQGVVARVEPYRYADALELARQPSPLLVCLDRVTDPRNLGAVARSAEGAGATGVIVPGARLGDGDARRSAARRPARSSTSRLRSSRTSRATWPRSRGPISGSTARRARRGSRCGRPTSRGGAAFVFGAEGRGLRPLVRRTCDELVSIPLAGSVESLNVSVAAAVLLVRGAKAAEWLSRPSTSSTASTFCTRAASRTPAS